MWILACIIGRHAHMAQHVDDACLDFIAIRGQPQHMQGFGDEPGHAPARIQAGVGVLEDHLAAAAQGQPLLGRQACSITTPAIDALEGDASAVRFQQARHHAGNGGLARTGLTDQTEGAAARDGEAHIVDGLQDARGLTREQALQPAGRQIEATGEVLDGEQRRAGIRLLGVISG